MAKSTATRKTIVSNAARDLVKALEKRGLTCIVVHDMAAFLQGSKVVPKDVKIAVLPQSEGTLPKEQLGRYLTEQNPTKFRLRERKNKATVLSYYDSSVSPPKKTYCDFELISIQNPPPPEYRSELTSRVDGLPVISLLSIVVDKLRELLAQYDSSNNQSDFIRRPPKRLCHTLRTLLPTSGHYIYTPTDKSFRLEALGYFIRASSLFPEFSSGLSALIRACQHFKTIRLSRPNGVPILDVAQLFRGIDFNIDNRREPPILLDSLITSATEATIATIATTNVVEADISDDDTLVSPLEAELVSPFDEKVTTTTTTLETETTVQAKTADEIRTEVIVFVARKVVEILQKVGVESALFGSLACHLYGNKRAPNDVDIITFPPPGRLMTAEWLKQAIANGDPDNFLLESARNPQATYRILYYRVDESMAPTQTFHKDKCKVDVLLPGILHLPTLPSYNIKWKSDLPVVPFSLLLLQKLQGWDDHRRMPEPYKYEKHVTDASDVLRLLTLEHAVPLRFSKPWSNRQLFNEEFYNLSVIRVKQFAAIHPACSDAWVRLGFDI